jgi:L-cysteine S-thiosulfotransferase
VSVRHTALAILVALVAICSAAAQQKSERDWVRADAAVREAFPTTPADWQPRLSPDETLKQCSAHDNVPPPAIFEKIKQRESAQIDYPFDHMFQGDWQKGERLAQSGYGLRFTDYPPRTENGGNCYACHQLTRQELSYGTLGPSLLQYGKVRNFSAVDTKATYERIYNPHATFPCSNMPRFGTNKILTIVQIKDIVALLMSPESPVNK